ncbi:MAG TPA: DPP IV N-terminal domain-containing protein [Gemmatimonadales bacterium]|nr:DPP IV N-terminal domain-containing protein [Gemmatimonadales bacterium]
MRRLSRLLTLAVLLAPAPLLGQYFGQNKVQYTTFDFRVIETEHFDVYYYEEEREAAFDVARMAERSYARLSRILRHQFRERKPIILYASHSDFQQTNTTPGEVGEGTGGFTDFLKHRNVLPMTGSYADVAHVLQHEMVHQFQYDVWSGGRAGGGLQTLIAVNPPLWFVEGMAEYLSVGPVDPNTAMWLRDASVEGKLPTIRQLETDPTIFPYRFGQAIVSYIGERWGDEAIGAVLSASRAGSLEGAMRRVIGLDFVQLGDQWRDAVQKQYLPQLRTQSLARDIATPVLNKTQSDGTLHLAPALSPDGTRVAYYSEADFFFVDLYLAEVPSGKRIRRLLKSTWSSDYETFRFINSSAAWSADGKYLVFSAKRGPRDDIVIVEPARNREVRRIRVDLNGVTTPTFSPDGRRIVFSGLDGGMSDLFVIDVDGTNLQRLTNDRYADMHPVFSPDGSTIAFTTDRGPDTDFEKLVFGNERLATYDLATGRIELLPSMEQGKNVNPQWSPDGRSIAYVSDRTGVSNIFLYDLDDRQTYQLTDLFTGAQGITPLSPVISWAAPADRLAFVYYEDGEYNVYTLDNPRGRKGAPWRAEDARLAVLAPPTPTARQAEVSDSVVPQASGGQAIYVSPRGQLRQADSLGVVPDSLRPPPVVSIQALNDSSTLGLPDTSTFTERPYKVGFSPDFVARPSIGYTRDNFGRGVFGGTAISLSDMLGDRQLLFSGYINGRIEEAQVLAAYSNISRRFNWAVGIQQDPYFFFQGSGIAAVPESFENVLVTDIRRLVLRSAFAQGAYPLSRFRRIELGLSATLIDDAIVRLNEFFDPITGLYTREPSVERFGLESNAFIQPSVAFVEDNTLYGFIGPMYGRRARFSIAQTIGGWNYTQLTADYRRYDRLVGPFTLATRLLYFGRTGSDADRFTQFIGFPDLIRGHTSGSYRRNECVTALDDAETITGCTALDQLVGTSIGVFNAELRVPLISPLYDWSPRFLPPIEAALFYDAGVAWDARSVVQFSEREPGQSPLRVRTPLRSWGGSLRTNLFGFLILRFDYAKPINRPGTSPFWTISIGPTY